MFDRTGLALAAGTLLLAGSVANADLVTLTQAGGFTQLEQRAARANQAVFNQLLTQYCPAQTSTQCASGNFPDVPTFQVFDNVRELVQTANALEGSGETRFSLGLDREGLGFALRWTAAEEFAANTSVAKEFTNGQMANMVSRVTALRYGASGFSVAGFGMPVSEFPALAAYQGQGGRHGSAGSGGTQLSPWGAFANVTYGYGDKHPGFTAIEDAFDFDNVEGTFGVDYRFDMESGNSYALGATFGITQNKVDFDSSRSIVDGGMDGDGYSVGTFVMFSAQPFYASGLVGYQRMKFDVTRFIKYPSLNPDVESVSAQTSSSNDTTSWSAALTAGYTGQFRSISINPYLRLDGVRITVDGFKETDATAASTPGFDLNVSDQDIDSLQGIGGLRLAWALSTRIGVFVPYARGEYRREFEDSPHKIFSTYSPLGTPSGATAFQLPTQKIDSQYGVVTFGLQAHVRGPRQRTLEGAYFGGLHIFAEYRQVLGLQHVANSVYTGGVRYEF